MSKNVGTLVTSPVRPNDSLDQYPSAYANEIKGGLHSAQTIDEMNAMGIWLRVAGMKCYVVEADATYRLSDDLTTWLPDDNYMPWGVAPQLATSQFVKGFTYNTSNLLALTVPNDKDYTYQFGGIVETLTQYTDGTNNVSLLFTLNYYDYSTGGLRNINLSSVNSIGSGMSTNFGFVGFHDFVVRTIRAKAGTQITLTAAISGGTGTYGAGSCDVQSYLLQMPV